MSMILCFCYFYLDPAFFGLEEELGAIVLFRVCYYLASFVLSWSAHVIESVSLQTSYNNETTSCFFLMIFMEFLAIHIHQENTCRSIILVQFGCL